MLKCFGLNVAYKYVVKINKLDTKIFFARNMRRKRTETKDEHLIESMKSEKRKSITKTRTFLSINHIRLRKFFVFVRSTERTPKVI